MPAQFVAELCGIRTTNGKPNTSDNNDGQSIELGERLIEELGVPAGQVGPLDPGPLLELRTVERLRSLRGDLLIGPSSVQAFAQYAHLGVFAELKTTWAAGPDKLLASLELAIARSAERDRPQLERAMQGVRDNLHRQTATVERLQELMPEESILKLDVTVGEPSSGGGRPLLHIGLSSKWSLRTDRAQDCLSQGSKLVNQRRGRMPHFAVVTIEPRPAMLKILADGSGSIDCIYHLDLPALERTINGCAARRANPGAWSPKRTFDRLVSQGRIRDFTVLEAEVLRIPGASPLD